MKKLTEDELLDLLAPDNTVTLQLGWNVARYDIATGKLVGESKDLRDPEVAAEFAALDQRERHEANRVAVLAAS